MRNRIEIGSLSHNKFVQLQENVANNIENKMKKEIKSVENKINEKVEKQIEKKYQDVQDPVKQSIRTKLEFGAVIIGAIIFGVALAWNEVVKTIINNATSSYQNKIIKTIVYAGAVTLIAYIIVLAYNQYVTNNRDSVADTIELVL